MKTEASLTWDEAVPGGSGEDSTWGYLRVTHGATVLWGAARDDQAPGIRWTWIDLLEFLAQQWPWLIGEDGWPPSLMLSDLRPSDFDHARRGALEIAPPLVRRRIDDALFQFRERHDVSLALRGKAAPRFWVVRQGSEAWLGGASAVMTSWSDAEHLLVSIGDQIATRIAAHTDERSQQARATWNSRDDADSTLRAEAVLGVDSATVLRLVEANDPADLLELPPKGFGSSELAFAARLAAPSLRVETTRRLLDCIRQTPPRASSPKMASLAHSAEGVIDPRGYPHDQGVQLGTWLREKLGIVPNQRADPEALLASWDVACSTINLGDTAVDAIACWGTRHGPAVYVNADGKRAQNDAGRRATVAHEIAHLLVDRKRALPLSEVQGSLYRSSVERRANAFAAEFLMPQSVAGPAFAACSDEASAQQVLHRLQSRFGASLEIIAWQAINSEEHLPEPAREELARHVPLGRRWRFVES